MDENKRKHLDLIQAIITRLSNNSFLIKGWCITLMVGLFALYAKNSESKYIFICLYPTILFWIIDSYYLSLEKTYRSLYNNVRIKKEESIDFNLSMDIQEIKKYNWYQVMFTELNTIFYFFIILIITITILVF